MEKNIARFARMFVGYYINPNILISKDSKGPKFEKAKIFKFFKFSSTQVLKNAIMNLGYQESQETKISRAQVYKNREINTGAKFLILSKKSRFENLNFHKIHNFKVSFFPKFIFSKSYFSQNSHF